MINDVLVCAVFINAWLLWHSAAKHIYRRTPAHSTIATWSDQTGVNSVNYDDISTRVRTVIHILKNTIKVRQYAQLKYKVIHMVKTSQIPLPSLHDFEDELTDAFGPDAFEVCKLEAAQLIRDVYNGAATQPIYFANISQSFHWLPEEINFFTKVIFKMETSPRREDICNWFYGAIRGAFTGTAALDLVPPDHVDVFGAHSQNIAKFVENSGHLNANTEKYAGLFGILAYDRHQRSTDFGGTDSQKKHALEMHRAFVADLSATLERGNWMEL
jgi:hypothetical protein